MLSIFFYTAALEIHYSISLPLKKKCHPADAELPPEASLVRQAEDRAHRQGQKNPVNVYFLCARGTCDERNWQRLNARLARVAVVHDGPLHLQQQHTANNGRFAGQKPASRALSGAVNDNDVDCTARHNGGGGGDDAGLVVCDVMDIEPTQYTSSFHGDCSLDNTQDDARDAVAVGNEHNTSDVSTEHGTRVLDPGGVSMHHCTDAEDAIVVDLTLPTHTTDCPPLLRNTMDVTAPLVTCPVEPPPGALAPITTERVVSSVPCTSDHNRWWFEVSLHTHRVRFHAAQDRSLPLLLSIPLCALLVEESPVIEQVVSAVRAQLQRQEAHAMTASTPPAALLGSSSLLHNVVVDGIGPVGINLEAISRSLDAFVSCLAAARVFVAEWRELPIITRCRLYNTVLQSPLEDAALLSLQSTVEQLPESICGKGTRERFVAPSTTDQRHKHVTLPSGGQWLDVAVHFTKYNREVIYRQAIIPITPSQQGEEGKKAVGEGKKGDGLPCSPSHAAPSSSTVYHRACVHCIKVVTGSDTTLSIATSLPSTCLLFCSSDCEQKYILKSSSGAMRRGVFSRDRGICSRCTLDCTAMIRRLQAIERGTRRWKERRRCLLEREYPDFVERAGEKSVRLLVERAMPGHAWQADHIVPVYQGGGQCDLDNLRTLCTVCHKEVTKAQAKQRAAERRELMAEKNVGVGSRKRRGDHVMQQRKKRAKSWKIDESDGDDGVGGKMRKDVVTLGDTRHGDKHTGDNGGHRKIAGGQEAHRRKTRRNATKIDDSDGDDDGKHVTGGSKGPVAVVRRRRRVTAKTTNQAALMLYDDDGKEEPPNEAVVIDLIENST